MSLGNIANVCEVHKILPIANDEPHFALVCFGDDSWPECDIAFTKNATWAQGTCGQSALRSIGLQD